MYWNVVTDSIDFSLTNSVIGRKILVFYIINWNNRLKKLFYYISPENLTKYLGKIKWRTTQTRQRSNIKEYQVVVPYCSSLLFLLPQFVSVFPSFATVCKIVFIHIHFRIWERRSCHPQRNFVWSDFLPSEEVNCLLKVQEELLKNRDGKISTGQWLEPRPLYHLSNFE